MNSLFGSTDGSDDGVAVLLSEKLVKISVIRENSSVLDESSSLTKLHSINRSETASISSVGAFSMKSAPVRKEWLSLTGQYSEISADSGFGVGDTGTLGSYAL